MFKTSFCPIDSRAKELLRYQREPDAFIIREMSIMQLANWVQKCLNVDQRRY